MLVKQGIKLWTDGSPWVGNIATSFPYLDTATTERAGINPAELVGRSRCSTPCRSWRPSWTRPRPRRWQMAIHANGDLAIDQALNAYEGALKRNNLLGTDHRWRIEHAGAARRPQFDRAASLGVYVSMSPFQYYYWGDLLDGQMFASQFGAPWQAFGDAAASGAVVSFHNDGSVSPPSPILNIATAVTRLTVQARCTAPNR